VKFATLPETPTFIPTLKTQWKGGIKVYPIQGGLRRWLSLLNAKATPFLDGTIQGTFKAWNTYRKS
jgi:hypothetical protein